MVTAFLPFVVSKPYTREMINITVYRIAFLLEGGERLIYEEDGTDPVKFLTEMDIFPLTPATTLEKNSPLLIPVDPKRTNMADFAFYEDESVVTQATIDSGTLMWRSYYVFQDSGTGKDILDDEGVGGERGGEGGGLHCGLLQPYIGSALKVWRDIYV